MVFVFNQIQFLYFLCLNSAQWNEAHSKKETDDLILIDAAKKNPEAFEALYNKYFYKIYTYIHARVKDKNITDDLTSDTFYKAFVHLKTFQNQGYPFSSWLYKIASNELKMFFRRNKKHVQHIDIQNTAIQDLLEEILDLSIEENVLKLTNILSELTYNDLQLIQWRYFEEKSFKEIGLFLSITEANAKTKTYRVVDRIKKTWKQKYHD